MTLTFGTDGVRGDAEVLLTDERVVALGRAAAQVLGGPAFVLGRDTRESGARIVDAFATGLAAEGVGVRTAGVAPTPAVAWLAAEAGLPAAMVSASHNPWQDNGIKLFSAGGRKLPDEVEARLEAAYADAASAPAAPSGAVADPTPTPLDGYEAAVMSSIEGRRLDGLHVVVDCANGAASHVAPEVLRRLGARVDVIGAEPDGRNINEGCGSTHPGPLRAAVRAAGAAVGLAFDGDADRVLAVDEAGALVDGDRLIALCATDLHARGRLRGDAVVVTVMTNLGFRRAMEAAGIEVIETAVGDRYVLEALDASGASLGGEQSGHVIFRELATTGDGLLTGVQVLDLVGRSGRPLSVLADEAFVQVPQVLRNVEVAHRDPHIASTIGDEIAREEATLGGDGRVLIRPSGTEPLVRVMVEATDAAVADAVAARLVAAVGDACGLARSTPA